VYQRTAIPLSGVPTIDLQSIQGTIPATSLADAQRIVGNIRSDYQTCLNAYAKLAAYKQARAKYHAALSAYRKKYGTTRPTRVKGRTVRPPTPPRETQPTIPAGCPGPAATGTGGTP
jgi:hypothetical protein